MLPILKRGLTMKHNHIAGRTASITPCVDAQFPRHSAILTIRQDGKREPIYMEMMRTFDDAVRYCRAYGYDVPVGFSA
jgi:hypothetical protein